LAETYDRDLADIFAVQDEIVRMVASRVGAEIVFRRPLTGGRARLSALEYALKARPFLRQFTPEGTEQARLLNLKAIEADPTSPVGYVGLAFTYVRERNSGWTKLSPEKSLEQAREAAEKALELDPNYYDAHFAMAYVHVQAGEQAQAIARFERSIELNPSATNVMASLSEPLIYAGRVDEAIELLHRAMRLDPHHPGWFNWNLAWAQWTVGDCDTALATILSMAKIPNMARRMLANIYVCLGRQEEAEAAIAKLLENRPGYTIADVRRAMQAKYAGPDMERYIDGLRIAGLPE
jgi:tetratricopeptide (TPR) repeat protein